MDVSRQVRLGLTCRFVGVGVAAVAGMVVKINNRAGIWSKGLVKYVRKHT